MADVIFDKQDQLERIEAPLFPGEKIKAVFDLKGAGTGFLGITSKRVAAEYFGRRLGRSRCEP